MVTCAFESQRRLYLNVNLMTALNLTRIIQSLYYAPAGRYINAWMHSLIKSVKPEIVNRYDLWVLRHKIGGAKQVFVNKAIRWSDQIPIVYIAHIYLTLII